MRFYEIKGTYRTILTTFWKQLSLFGFNDYNWSRCMPIRRRVLIQTFIYQISDPFPAHKDSILFYLLNDSWSTQFYPFPEYNHFYLQIKARSKHDLSKMTTLKEKVEYFNLSF